MRPWGPIAIFGVARKVSLEHGRHHRGRRVLRPRRVAQAQAACGAAHGAAPHGATQYGARAGGAVPVPPPVGVGGGGFGGPAVAGLRSTPAGAAVAMAGEAAKHALEEAKSLHADYSSLEGVQAP